LLTEAQCKETEEKCRHVKDKIEEEKTQLEALLERILKGQILTELVVWLQKIYYLIL
jgi:hypothetical protein